jgi:hypothetical protein
VEARVDEWRRLNRVNWWWRVTLVSFLVFEAFRVSFFGDFPEAVAFPMFGLFVMVIFVNWWILGRDGVFVSDRGVLVQVRHYQVVVPWQEIAYAEVAEAQMFPKIPKIWLFGPSLGLWVVAPSGSRHELRVKPGVLPVIFQFVWGMPPYVGLSRNRMMRIVDCINEVAARQRLQASPPAGGGPFPPS